MAFLADAGGWIYFVVTILLVVFLYAYIYHMYRAQKSGAKDYEKYARLALDDNISDVVLESRERGRKGQSKAN